MISLKKLKLMFDIPENAANAIFYFSNILLVIGAVFALVGTIGVIWAGGLREKFSDIKISKNMADTAKANEGAALANKRANEASLKLEAFKQHLAPRQINRDIFLKIIAEQPKAFVEVLYLRDDPECFNLAQQLYFLLQQAKWEVLPLKPIPVTWESLSSSNPTAMSVDGQPSGVTVVVRSASLKEAEATVNMHIGKDWVKTPWTGLQYVFSKSLENGVNGGTAGGQHPPPEGTLRVVVAPRE